MMIGSLDRFKPGFQRDGWPEIRGISRSIVGPKLMSARLVTPSCFV
jgi:hypothetical protein